MRIKGKDLIGLRVITTDLGQEIEKVKELIYDPEVGKILALVVDPGGWFKDAKIIPFEKIKTIGKDAVMIETEGVVKNAGEVSQKISRIVEGDDYLNDNNLVITEDGTELGKVSDVYFDTDSGEVMEFEISQGIKNLSSGKKRIKKEDVVKIGENAIIVKRMVAGSLEQQEQTQGIGGAINQARQQAPNVVNQVRQEVSRVDTQGLKNQAQGVVEAVRQKLTDSKEKVEEERKNGALGRYLTINLIGPNDQIIAARGDLVTHEILDQAENSGMLAQVLSNVSEEPVQD
jgi:uncharacterized protein YrrD